jgi:hypothetical protein
MRQSFALMRAHRAMILREMGEETPTPGRVSHKSRGTLRQKSLA